jgi:hypothetical protein
MSTTKGQIIGELEEVETYLINLFANAKNEYLSVGVNVVKFSNNAIRMERIKNMVQNIDVKPMYIPEEPKPILCNRNGFEIDPMSVSEAKQ